MAIVIVIGTIIVIVIVIGLQVLLRTIGIGIGVIVLIDRLPVTITITITIITITFSSAWFVLDAWSVSIASPILCAPICATVCLTRAASLTFELKVLSSSHSEHAHDLCAVPACELPRVSPRR